MTTELQTEAGVAVSTETLADSLEVLKGKIDTLQGDIEQRRDGLEHNIILAKKQRDQEIVELRGEYDKAVNKGDKIGVGKILDQIAAARKKLESVAKDVMASSGDFSDFKNRSDELHSEISAFCGKAKENFFRAKKVNEEAASLSGFLSWGLGRRVRELQSLIDKAKKIAEQILSE